jgi:hypothetical protein
LPTRRSISDATTAPQSLSRLQGQGGVSRDRRQRDARRARAAVRCAPESITEWRRQLVANAADAFAAETERREPPIDVKALHAKIGQQALELDFLSNALGRDRGPSRKR